MKETKELLRPGAFDFEPTSDAFEGVLARRERKQRNRRIRAGAVGVIVALATGLVLARSLTSDGIPADRPVAPTPVPVGVSGALAYALDGAIYIADPDGMNAVKIAAAGTPDEGCAGTVGYSLPSWSPDGSYLAYERDCTISSYTDPSAVVISDADGTVVAEIPASGFGWSPNSARLAVWGDSQRTVDIYGVDGVRLASLPSPITGRPAENVPEWLPDGSAILVRAAAPPSLMALPLDGSPAYELSAALQIASPDGTRVAVIGDHSAVITDAGGAPVSEVSMSLRGAVWLPDGERFASVSRRGDLVVVDATSGEVTVLTEAKSALPNAMSVNTIRGFSPQDDRILYAALVRGEGGGVYNSLFSIAVDGSDARLLVDGAMQGQWRPR